MLIYLAEAAVVYVSSMTTQKLSGVGRIRWTEDHRSVTVHSLRAVALVDLIPRRALFLLRTELDVDSDLEVKTFSKVSDKINASPRKLRSQYDERKKPDSQHLWQFLQATSIEEASKRKTMRQRLQDAARDLSNSQDQYAQVERATTGSTQSRKRVRSQSLQAEGDDVQATVKHGSQKRVCTVVIDKEERDAARAQIDTLVARNRSNRPSNNGAVLDRRSATSASQVSRAVRGLPQWPDHQPMRPRMLFR